jgi:hypothetical protein
MSRAFLNTMTGRKATGWTMSGCSDQEKGGTGRQHLGVQSRWQCVGLTERMTSLFQVASHYANSQRIIMELRLISYRCITSCSIVASGRHPLLKRLSPPLTDVAIQGHACKQDCAKATKGIPTVNAQGMPARAPTPSGASTPHHPGHH